MDFNVAAIVAQHGISPQDFEALAEEFDLLSVADALLHDPDACLEATEHLDSILAQPVIWLPARAPFGDLWQEVRVGATAAEVSLCPNCYPRVG